MRHSMLKVKIANDTPHETNRGEDTKYLFWNVYKMHASLLPVCRHFNIVQLLTHPSLIFNYLQNIPISHKSLTNPIRTLTAKVPNHPTPLNHPALPNHPTLLYQLTLIGQPKRIMRPSTLLKVLYLLVLSQSTMQAQTLSRPLTVSPAVEITPRDITGIMRITPAPDVVVVRGEGVVADARVVGGEVIGKIVGEGKIVKASIQVLSRKRISPKVQCFKTIMSLIDKGLYLWV